MPVAKRVNYKFYKDMPSQTPVRIAGRFAEMSEGGELNRTLTPTDGGAIPVLAPEGQGADFFKADAGFVEVLGLKDDSGSLKATFVAPLGEQLDVELLEEAIQMMNLPQLQKYYVPSQ
eukprot:CAMPEP_0178412154 /NCGR_PEP_ID=MMETSP0689_2-20121128/21864_1 /TAXON_ID=160604 /ORGANISM="Amphidinium massartii, Strain CS-259" /LENGTH=117 /DNA_ID=CAMNT_0020033383 /DNA_START=109 /DNA_END=462 /DNA_ORIENTATION=-